MNKQRLWAWKLALSLIVLPAWAQEAPPLPAMGANLSQISVSGISSGGFMAAQLATTYSATFMGVGVIAAGPYYCAGTYTSLSFQQNAMTTCMTPSTVETGPVAAISLKNAEQFARAGKIDPVRNLTRQRVYIFSGSQDTTVKTVVVDQVADYYQRASVPSVNIVYNRTIAAGHSIVTAKLSDVACAKTEAPYINDCGFTQSQVLLKHIYLAATQPPAATASQAVLRFNQREFIHGTRTSMDDAAYAYIPAACQRTACAVHVALHGCEQGATVIGDHFYSGTGYNEFADTNQLIILYPQVHKSAGIPPNPKGCWDFWGYSSEDQSHPTFYTREAPQMKAIMAMIARLGQPRPVLASSTRP
jgi:poly(3-hydroxybutyrate) depolymerase